MKTYPVLLMACLFAGFMQVNASPRSGVNGQELALVYVVVAALLLLIGYSPNIIKYISSRRFHKHHESRDL